MGRTLRTRIPIKMTDKVSEVVKEAIEMDKETRKKRRDNVG